LSSRPTLIQRLQAYRQRLIAQGRMREAGVVARCIELARDANKSAPG